MAAMSAPAPTLRRLPWLLMALLAWPARTQQPTGYTVEIVVVGAGGA